MTALLKGKKIVVLGVSNKKSIAWGITEALHNAGAELAFTYLNEALEKRVRPLVESIGCQERLYQADVQSDEDIARLADSIKDTWGTVDGLSLIHI